MKKFKPITRTTGKFIEGLGFKEWEEVIITSSEVKQLYDQLESRLLAKNSIKKAKDKC